MTVIWDKLSPFYDIFEDIYNGRVNRGIASEIRRYIHEDDVVLECACGTGLLTVPIARNCRKLIATDYSVGMLKQTRKKISAFRNIRLQQASITELPYKTNAFDVVVAANVIHLLDDPEKAMGELIRVCKKGGTVVIPTYVNAAKKSASLAAKMLKKAGVDFKRQFHIDSYKKFFADMGFDKVDYRLIEGRMPCCFAVIVNE